MSLRISAPGFEKYQVLSIGPDNPLFRHVDRYPAIVKGPKTEWVMTATRKPDIFYPTRVADAMPTAIRGINWFRKEGDEFFPVR
jgi:hypothetical protein